MHASATRWLARRPAASVLAGVLALATVALMSAGTPSAVPSLVGGARVIDGDTLEVGGERVRLEGIDAPEMAQACARPAGGTWPCGRAAADKLIALIGTQPVACESRGTDKYGRILGVCFVDGRELNAAMVRSGLAWAFVRYSTRYVETEAEARALAVGLWQAETEPAWAYRARRWASAEQVAPQGCAIKGNISANGRIYHMPWSPWYGKVRINAGKGERWFCSEGEALAAGWRPAALH